MNTLCEIYNSLNVIEKRKLNEYYDLKFLNKSRWKILQLVKEGCRKNPEAILRVYGSPNKNSAFSLLKKKVKYDILEFLLISHGEEKFDFKGNSKTIEVLKKIMQAKLIHGRNGSLFSYSLFKEAQEEATEYQLLDMSIWIYNEIISIGRIRDKFEIIEEYFSLIDKKIFELKIRNAVRYCFTFIGVNNTTTTNRQVVLNDKFKERFKFVKENISLSEMDDSIIHFQLVKSIIALSNRKFEKALVGYEKALELVENSVVFKTSKVYRSGIKMSISKAHIYLNQYDKAFLYSEAAYKEFNPRMLNSLLALEHIFHSKFLLEEYEFANEILNKALKHKALSENAMRKARWLYYQSVLSYITDDRDLALKQLRANNEIHKDKTGWLLGFKLLEMMITIDNTDYYLATFQIERLNQVIHKNKHANVARVKIISQIIKAFLKYNCNFQETMDRVPDKFDLLEKEEGEYFWDPLGFEMIRFELWFKERA